MNEHRHIYEKDTGGEKTVQNLFAIRALQLLLAGMYFLLGIKLTKSEKAWQRDRAILMRKCIHAANRRIEIRRENRNVLDRFTNDHSPHWRERMRKCAIGVPGIGVATMRDLLATLCRTAGRSRLAPGLNPGWAGNTRVAQPAHRVRYDMAGCRAPP